MLFVLISFRGTYGGLGVIFQALSLQAPAQDFCVIITSAYPLHKDVITSRTVEMAVMRKTAVSIS